MARKNKRDKEDYLEFTREEIRNKRKDEIKPAITRKIKLHAKNKDQQALMDSIIKNEITICSGVPGSGKSFCALGSAINLLIDPDNFYEKIYLVKSVTPLKGEELGYLKGDLYEKLTPFMWSFDINLSKLIGEDQLLYLVGKKIVEYKPLAYMRGVTIDNAIVILDEGQNVSIDNSRTFLTRIGQNSKMICIGDENQIDLKYKEDSALKILLDIMSGIDGVGVIRMSNDEVNCRNPIISKLENKFNDYFGKSDKTKKRKKL